MYQFFIKLYIGIFFASFLSFATALAFLFFTVLLPHEWQYFQEDTAAEWQAINIQLIYQKPNNIQPFIDQHTSTFELDIAVYQQATLPPFIQQQFIANTTSDVLHKGASEWARYYHLPEYNIFIKMSEDVDFIFSDHLFSVFIAIPIFLVILTLSITMIIMIKRIASPLLTLEAISQRFGEGDLSVRMSTKPNDPIHSLATRFNQMAHRIEQSFQQQQIIIGALPHELRTPLHRIRFALDLTRRQQDLEKLRERIDQIDHYAEQLEQAVKDILEFSRLQNQPLSQPQTIQIQTLLQSITIEHTIQASINCPQELTITGNQRLLYRALLNLLSNAQRHKKHSIDIHVTQNQQQTIIRIDDDGLGIPEEHQEQIFTPFFRVDQSRNTKTGGVGLGLALVKLIIEKHSGEITANNNEIGGARLTVKLPI